MSKRNGTGRPVSVAGAAPEIKPPGKVRAKGHGLAAPLPVAAGADKLRQLLNLSGECPAQEVCETAAAEILRLRELAGVAVEE